MEIHSPLCREKIAPSKEKMTQLKLLRWVKTVLEENGDNCCKGYRENELFIGTLVDIQTKFTPLISSEYGGRRCEVINLEKHPLLNGKTCVVEDYLSHKDKCKIASEGSNDTSYYVYFKKGRVMHRNFATKEECPYHQNENYSSSMDSEKIVIGPRSE
jgi:hypothetical protein